MALLEVLSSAGPAQHPDGLSVSEAARLLGRDKSVVSRQLRSLLETGLVSRDEKTGRYDLSWRLFALAVHAADQRLTKLAGPLMLRLAMTVGERTYLSVLSDDEVLTVYSESSRRPVEAVNWTGLAVPPLRSSSGMALLMDHDDEHILDLIRRGPYGASERQADEFLASVRVARRRGYTVASRLFDPELHGIGVPVRDATGKIKAAMNISGPSSRVEPHLQAFAGQLVAAVKALEKSLRADARGNPA